jgi:hypothetical protein
MRLLPIAAWLHDSGMSTAAKACLTTDDESGGSNQT